MAERVAVPRRNVNVDILLTRLINARALLTLHKGGNIMLLSFPEYLGL